MRGLAALYVMVGHARWLLWEGYATGYKQHTQEYTLANKVLMYFFSTFLFGHEAVLLFFVLSGFVIHLRYAKQFKVLGAQASFDWGPYVRRRARRLYPTLIFAMALTVLLDLLGSRFGYVIYFQQTPYTTINENIIPQHDAQTLLGNLAFLMNTYVPTWGTNGPLWSLKYEWWFYMLYPLFWCISRKSILLSTGVMASLFVLSHWPGIWGVRLLSDVFGSMLAWWLGVLLADMYTKRIDFPMGRVAPLAALLGILSFSHISALPLGLLRDLLWALGFSGLIAACFFVQEKGRRLRLLERLKPLGDMSYTLYVIHFPIFVLMSGWLMSTSATNQLPRNFNFVIIGICGSLLIAYLTHFVVERPFMTPKRHDAQ
ncbi:MAG: hypothetical protein QOH49_3885 [Acidobacteriota bacterium]|nr:hypothetical protein [Acidobacteriota bacterium]